jgi:hypothetical protein
VKNQRAQAPGANAAGMPARRHAGARVADPAQDYYNMVLFFSKGNLSDSASFEDCKLLLRYFNQNYLRCRVSFVRTWVLGACLAPRNALEAA